MTMQVLPTPEERAVALGRYQAKRAAQTAQTTKPRAFGMSLPQTRGLFSPVVQTDPTPAPSPLERKLAREEYLAKVAGYVSERDAARPYRDELRRDLGVGMGLGMGLGMGEPPAVIVADVVRVVRVWRGWVRA